MVCLSQASSHIITLLTTKQALEVVLQTYISWQLCCLLMLCSNFSGYKTLVTNLAFFWLPAVAQTIGSTVPLI
jgi:hypothetical protein